MLYGRANMEQQRLDRVNLPRVGIRRRLSSQSSCIVGTERLRKRKGSKGELLRRIMIEDQQLGQD